MLKESENLKVETVINSARISTLEYMTKEKNLEMNMENDVENGSDSILVDQISLSGEAGTSQR